MISTMHMSIRVLVVSDSRSSEEAQDVAGEKLIEALHKMFPHAVLARSTVPDEKAQIKTYLKKYAEQNMDLVLTTGGTGFTPRDVTPEATREVIDKEAPGLAYTMLTRSLAKTEMAMLSRAVCGIASKTLIVNLPGSPKGAVECLDFIKEAIPHAINCINDRKEDVAREHIVIQQSSSVSQKQDSQSKVTVSKIAARNRMSPYPMVSVKEASQTIFKYCTPVHDTEAVPFEQAINRILAENVVTPEPVPAFRASIKDGYAVKSSDGAGRRKIKQATVAGDKPIVEELQDGEAVRISTGAPVPPGADAVVQVEDTKLLEANEDETEEISIEILKAPVANQDIRDIGSDCEKGYIVLNQFNRMGPAHVGVLAQLAKKEVKVFRKPTIGILSTGNELKEPWEKIEPGQIRDSNRYTLKHLLNRYHYDSTDCGMVKDDPSAIKQALEKALDENEFVITTGGASMGELDVVKRVLQEDFEARIHFGRINIKPGKPTSFATLSYKGKIKKVFCLPGNPASCTVCAIIFIIPVLRYIENEKVFQFPLLRIPLSQRLVNTDSRPDYLRVKVTTGLGCEPKIVLRRNQISSNLTSFCNANGLIIVPPQQHQEEELEGEELDLTRFVVPNPSHTFAPTASHTFAPTASHAGQQTPPNRPRALLGPTPVIQTIVDDRPKYTVIMFEQIVRPPPQ